MSDRPPKTTEIEELDKMNYGADCDCGEEPDEGNSFRCSRGRLHRAPRHFVAFAASTGPTPTSNTSMKPTPPADQPGANSFDDGPASPNTLPLSPFGILEDNKAHGSANASSSSTGAISTQAFPSSSAPVHDSMILHVAVEQEGRIRRFAIPVTISDLKKLTAFLKALEWIIIIIMKLIEWMGLWEGDKSEVSFQISENDSLNQEICLSFFSLGSFAQMRHRRGS